MAKKRLLIVVLLTGLLIVVYLVLFHSDLPANYGEVETRLYLGKSAKQPLVVAFGGSEGGNVYATEMLKEVRDKFLENGYAFLTVGYFGSDHTPSHLDRISINAIHDSILSTCKNPAIDKEKIALFGGSRGAELALTLASRYPDIDAVIAIVPSHVNFPSIKPFGESSAWHFNDEPLPYVPSSQGSDAFAEKGEWTMAFNKMLENRAAVEKSRIKVENINGPILLISAKKDEAWPSYPMANEITKRLALLNFKHKVEHVAVEGGHTDAARELDLAIRFLEENFKKK